MPLALVFGFLLEMGLVGFWLGFMIAMFLLDFVVTIVIATANWEIGMKNDEPELRLTRQNSFVSCGSESSNRKSMLGEPMIRKTRQNSFLSHGSESSKKALLVEGDILMTTESKDPEEEEFTQASSALSINNKDGLL